MVITACRNVRWWRTQFMRCQSRRASFFVSDIFERKIKNDPWGLSLMLVVYNIENDGVRFTFDTFYCDFALNTANFKANCPKVFT
jgi:hypothetical protein